MRKRNTLDISKMREAFSGPEMDTRVWCALARVDDDPDALRWYPKLGWIVDVTVHGGKLDQEGPIAVRIASGLATGDAGASAPVQQGDELLVIFPTGDANDGGIAPARLNNGENPVPTSVNGFPVDEAFAALNLLLRSQAGMQVELDGLTQLASKLGVQLMASSGLLLLGGGPTSPPTEPVIKGTQFLGALSPFHQAMFDWAVEITAVVIAITGAYIPVVSPVPVITLGAKAVALAAAQTAFGPAATASLSLRTLTE